MALVRARRMSRFAPSVHAPTSANVHVFPFCLVFLFFLFLSCLDLSLCVRQPLGVAVNPSSTLFTLAPLPQGPGKCLTSYEKNCIDKSSAACPLRLVSPSHPQCPLTTLASGF